MLFGMPLEKLAQLPLSFLFFIGFLLIIKEVLKQNKTNIKNIMKENKEREDKLMLENKEREDKLMQQSSEREDKLMQQTSDQAKTLTTMSNILERIDVRLATLEKCSEPHIINILDGLIKRLSMLERKGETI
jgi:hypothetical protein